MSDHLFRADSVFWADYSLSSCGPQRPISVSWKCLFSGPKWWANQPDPTSPTVSTRSVRWAYVNNIIYVSCISVYFRVFCVLFCLI